MRKLLIICFVFFAGLGFSFSGTAQQSNFPWKESQLKKPSVLAMELSLPKKDRPVVIDMGPAGRIKHAIEIGPAEYDKNKKKLRDTLKNIPKDKEVIVYCGCCPFTKCPNAQPAFKILVDMGFKKARLLNLPHNLKIDWIDKGYPLAEK